MRLLCLLTSITLLGGCFKFQQGLVSLYGQKNFVQINKEKIYLEQEGQGEAVLLVHGFGASHSTWDAMRPALKERYRVLALDLPGHGFSDKYPGDYSMPAIARKVLKVLDSQGVKQVHVVAHSWGTAISLTLAQLAPQRVRSLTLISSFAYEEQLPPFLTWSRVAGLGEILFGMFWTERVDDRLGYAFYDADRFATPEVADKVRKVYERPGVLAAALAAARGIRFTELQQSYRRMKIPTLVISGREDRVTRLPAARRLNSDLPNSRHVVIPLCGHMAPLEHPTKVLREIFLFHAEVGTQRKSPPLPQGEPKKGARGSGLSSVTQARSAEDSRRAERSPPLPQGEPKKGARP